MRPDVSRTLQGVGINLLVNVAADVKTPFGLQTVNLAGALALMASEEAERAVERLTTENRLVRDILRDGLELAGERRPAVEAGLATPPAPNLLVSSLQAENDALRRALIELHSAVEVSDAAEAQAMNERIWAELVESTRRRQFAARLG
jgi:hypothetical protein